MDIDKITDRLAELEHKQWCDWAKSILKEENISPERAKRWEYFINTPWSDLKTSEIEQDKIYALKVMDVITDELKKELNKWSFQISDIFDYIRRWNLVNKSGIVKVKE